MDHINGCISADVDHMIQQQASEKAVKDLDLRLLSIYLFFYPNMILDQENIECMIDNMFLFLNNQTLTKNRTF